MSAAHAAATATTTTTTLSDSLGRSSVTPCTLDTNRVGPHPYFSSHVLASVSVCRYSRSVVKDYNHAVYGSHMSPSVGSLHYALPQQSHAPPRTLIPPGGDGGSASGQQQQTDPQMFRPPTHELSHQAPRSAGKRKQHDPFGEDKGNKRRRQGSYGGVDGDEGGTNSESHGAKHWTDDEKTKFFIWLLGSDEHWDTFTTKMNTCFREVISAHLCHSSA
jgi:hypothetical protein